MIESLLQTFNSVHHLVVSLDSEEVWRCLGPAGAARERLHAEVARYRDEAEAISTPIAVSRALAVETMARGEIRFADGIAIQHKRLPHLFEGADGALFIIATAGPGVEARATEYFAKGDHIGGLVIDAAGTATVQNAFEQTLARLTWPLQLDGYQVGPSIVPGSDSWDIEGQRVIFDVLPAHRIGVTLLESLMMSPQKTRSQVVPFGRDLKLTRDPDSTQCRTCRAKKCPMRIEEYAGPLGE